MTGSTSLSLGGPGRRRPAPPVATAFIVALLSGSIAVPRAQMPVAQETPPAAQPAPRPTFRVEANLVRVDAIVTKDGQAVRDLTQADFEVLEDGAPQKLASFERVDITETRLTRPPGREPATAAEARAAAEDPRARVFVVFLDRYHTGIAGSHRMQRALGTLLQRIIGPDDLVAVMIPDMSASDIAFTRRTGPIEEMLQRNWTWGVRGQIAAKDPEEQMYETCFPDFVEPGATAPPISRDPQQPAGTPAGMFEGGRVPVKTVAQEMIDRRREKRTLDALTDLSVFLRGVREERKAVIVVSDGWALYRPDERLARLRTGERVPGVGMPGTDPQGRLVPDASRARTEAGQGSTYECEVARQRLAMIDNRQTYMDLMDYANRGNVTFYPVDSRGLPVFDTDLSEKFVTPGGSLSVLPPSTDQRLLTQRIETLQTLAVNTDGIAVVNRNDIERGLERVVADLSSYYLMSYYSTNGTLDGKYRQIQVRVKRPGVEVRARKGYRAATAEEMTAGATAAAAAPTMPAQVQAAFAALGSSRPEVRMRTRAGVAAAGDQPRVWVIAELDQGLARSPEWTAGGTVQVSLVGSGGAPVSSASATIQPGSRTVQLELTPQALPAGDYQVRTRATPGDRGLPLADIIGLRVPAEPTVGVPRIGRRGPTTGLQYHPTADVRFRRTERVRFEWVSSAGACVSEAEVLDQRGQRMPIPVTTLLKPCDAATGDAQAPGVELVLAPFAAADYGVRVLLTGSSGQQEAVAAFRVVP
jgi:VWFA-related protein